MSEMRLQDFQITPLHGYTTRMCGYTTQMDLNKKIPPFERDS